MEEACPLYAFGTLAVIRCTLVWNSGRLENFPKSLLATHEANEQSLLIIQSL